MKGLAFVDRAVRATRAATRFASSQEAARAFAAPSISARFVSMCEMKRRAAASPSIAAASMGAIARSTMGSIAG